MKEELKSVRDLGDICNDFCDQSEDNAVIFLATDGDKVTALFKGKNQDLVSLLAGLFETEVAEDFLECLDKAMDIHMKKVRSSSISIPMVVDSKIKS